MENSLFTSYIQNYKLFVSTTFPTNILVWYAHYISFYKDSINLSSIRTTIVRVCKKNFT